MFSVVTSLWEEMTNEVMTGERLAAVCDKFTVHLRSTFTQGWGFCFDPPSLTTCDNFRKRKTISSDQTVLLQASLRVAEDLTHYCFVTELKKLLHAQLLLPDSKSHEAHYGFTQKQLNKKHVLSFHSWRTQYTAKWMTLDTLNADVSGGDFTLWEDMSVEVMTGDRFAVVCGKYTKHHRSSFTQGWEVCFNLTPPIKSDNFLNKETMSSGQNILTWYIITCCRRSNLLS